MLTKDELVNRTHAAAQTDHFVKGEKPSKALVQRIVELAFCQIADSLEAGVPAFLPRVGRLSVKSRPATKTRNPRTSEIMEIPAKRVVRLTTGKEIKGRINKGAAKYYPAPESESRGATFSTTEPKDRGGMYRTPSSPTTDKS